MIRILIAAAMLVAGARPALASCVTDGQGPCYRFWKYEAVFVAKVLGMVELRDDRVKIDGGTFWLSENYRLQVRVVEAFRGVKAGAVMTLFAPDGVCGGINAEDGGELFVYASRNESGELWAQGCGVSGPLEDAEADLAYARSVNAGGPSALFYGDVFQREDHTGDSSDFSPMREVRIRVRGPNNFEAETKTDEEGNYSLTLPGAGKYTGEVIPPRGFANRFGDGPITFELTDGRACFREDFQLQLNGRITGHVVNDKGEPVSNLVVRDGAGKQSSKTDADGAFDIGPVEGGIYSISMITGSRSTRFADAGLVTVVAGRATSVPPVTLPAGMNLVTLSVNVSIPADAGEVSVLLTAKPGGEEIGKPILIGSEPIQFLVDRNASFEVLAVSLTHEAKAVARTSSPLTEVTLTLRPQTTPQ